MCLCTSFECPQHAIMLHQKLTAPSPRPLNCARLNIIRQGRLFRGHGGTLKLNHRRLHIASSRRRKLLAAPFPRPPKPPTGTGIMWDVF